MILFWGAITGIYCVKHPTPIVSYAGQAETPKCPKNSNAKQLDETLNRDYSQSRFIYHHFQSILHLNILVLAGRGISRTVRD